MESLFWFFLLVSSGICAWLGSHVADAKGIHGNWGAAGFFFGPLALLALAGMPDRKMHRYLRAIAENAGVELSSIDKFPEEQINEDVYSFVIPRVSTDKEKLTSMINAIANDDRGLSQLVSAQRSKVYPSRIIANNSEGKTIAQAFQIRRGSETIYWKIKYPSQ